MVSVFKDELGRKVSEYPTCRPYVCKGRPSDCKVFIVGCNPATDLRNPFSKYILDDSGKFDFKTFMDDYTAERRGRTTKTGRPKRELSPTRKNMEEIRKAAAPTEILETNVYSLPSPSRADLQQRNTDIFEFLVSKIRPERFVLHGNDATDAFQELYKCVLERTAFGCANLIWNRVAIDGRTCEVLALPPSIPRLLLRGGPQDWRES